MRLDILSLFPEVFLPVLSASILRIAAEKKLVEYHVHDIRDYSRDKHKKVDDRPYGGGPGMVLKCGPVVRAFESVMEMDERPAKGIMMTPQGRQFKQSTAHEFSNEERLVLLCGHYEGFDERIRRILPLEEISIGDYVLSGGEIAAMVVVDSVVRLLPGVLGHEQSPQDDSFADGMLEYPHYTRPAEYRGLKVPDVLLSGHHKEIKKWRRLQSEKRTSERRSDLITK